MAKVASAQLGSALNNSALRALSAQGVIKAYPKNAVIVSEGDDTDSFFILVAGRVKVYVSDEDGREVVLRVLSAGDRRPRLEDAGEAVHCRAQSPNPPVPGTLQ